MLRWIIEKGAVPIPKSSHPQRIQENIEVFDFELSKDDMKILDSLNEDFRTCWDPNSVV